MRLKDDFINTQHRFTRPHFYRGASFVRTNYIGRDFAKRSTPGGNQEMVNLGDSFRQRSGYLAAFVQRVPQHSPAICDDGSTFFPFPGPPGSQQPSPPRLIVIVIFGQNVRWISVKFGIHWRRMIRWLLELSFVGRAKAQAA